MVAFNLGALPGTDLIAAADVIAGETGDCRTIPRLPARGLGFDPVGFCCALFPELPIDRGPRSWRLTARPQLISRQLWDHSARDSDVLEAEWGSAGGYTVQLSVLGPWSLATEIELTTGHRALTDTGAVTDIAEIYAHRIALKLNELQRRFNAAVRVLILEPHLGAIATGQVPGTSDFDKIAKLSDQQLGQLLHRVVAQLRENSEAEIYLGSVGVYPQIQALSIAEADGLVVSRSAIAGTMMLDACGELLAAGLRLGIGCVQLDDDTSAEAMATDLLKLIGELGLAPDILAKQIDITCSQQLYPGTLLNAAHALSRATKIQELVAR